MVTFCENFIEKETVNGMLMPFNYSELLNVVMAYRIDKKVVNIKSNI